MDQSHKDLKSLKNRLYNPSLRMVSPFMPFLVYSSVPVSGILLLFPILDFFSEPGRVSRIYIPNYEKWYLILFSSCFFMRIALEFLPVHFWLLPIFIVPFAFVAWVKFAWQTWFKLYDSVQQGNAL